MAVIEAAGYRPVVVDYLSVDWTRELLLTLLTAAELTARQALRETKSPAEAMELLEDGVTDEAVFEAMLREPVLVNRPFVVTGKGVALCRPSERVLDVLERWPAGPFLKEDGSVLIDAEGRRVVG